MLVAVRGTAGVMTLRRVCSVRTRRVTGRGWVTVRCRRGWRLARAWRWRTVRSGRSGSRRGCEMAVDGRFAQGAWGRRGGGPAGGRGEVVTGPVSDWATDFSHLDPEWTADPYPIQDELRRRCPIARTRRFGGAWLPTLYRDIAAIAYDPGNFSSRAIIVTNFRPPRDRARAGGSPPITSDPPFHREARRLLLPAFTKTAVGGQEPATVALCHALIDAFAGRDVVDAARDYAQHVPVRVIAGILGFPPQDAPQFREFVRNPLEGVNLPPQQRLTRMSALFRYLLAQVQDHVSDPRDDLTGYLLNAELDGRKLDPPHIVGTMALLLIAGIDTTWSALGASLWHLAQAPHDRRRLAADPGLLPTAIEGFLRGYAPATTARLVT